MDETELVEAILDSADESDVPERVTACLAIYLGKHWKSLSTGKTTQIIDRLGRADVRAVLQSVVTDMDSVGALSVEMIHRAKTVVVPCVERHGLDESCAKIVKYLIYILLEAKSVESFHFVSDLAPYKDRGLDHVYPGVVTKAVQVITSDSNNMRVGQAAVDIWTAWVPVTTAQTDDDVRGSLLAFGKVRESINALSVAPLLCELIRFLPMDANRDVVDCLLRLHTPTSDTVVEKLAPVAQYRVRDAIGVHDWEIVRGWLSMYSALCGDPDLHSLLVNACRLYLDVSKFASKYPISTESGPSDLNAILDETVSQQIVAANTADPVIPTESILHCAFPDLPIVREIIQMVGPANLLPIVLSSGDCGFSHLLLLTVLLSSSHVDELTILRLVNVFPDNAYDQFALLILLTRHAPSMEKNRVVFKSLFHVLRLQYSSVDFHRSASHECLGAFARAGRLPTVSSLVEKHLDTIIDSLITSVRIGRTRLCDSHQVVLSLVSSYAVPPSHLIDLSREILATYPPRDMPLWALRVLFVMVKSCPPPSSGQTEACLLSPSQLLANECISRVKYCIDLNVAGEDQVDALARSAWAIMTVIECIRILNVPEMQIVKLCDTFPFLVSFMQPDGSGYDDVRLIVGLEVVSLISETHKSVWQFFTKRLDNDVWSLVLARTDRLSNSESCLDSEGRLRRAINQAVHAATKCQGLISDNDTGNRLMSLGRHRGPCFTTD